MIGPEEPDLHITSDLQAIVTGMLMAVTGQIEHNVAVALEFPPDDENGIHRPWFDIIGRQSGTRVRVMVVTVE